MASSFGVKNFSFTLSGIGGFLESFFDGFNEYEWANASAILLLASVLLSYGPCPNEDFLGKFDFDGEEGGLFGS